MPIYIPDSSKVIREMSPITVTTSDKITREIAEAWHTGADGVSRKVYENEVYLMQNGEFNPKIVSGYLSTKYGYDASIEKTDEGIKMRARRGSASGSYEGYTYITLNNSLENGEAKREYLFNLIKNKKRICFDVSIYYSDKSAVNTVFGWVGLNPSASENMPASLRTYHTSPYRTSFSGILQVDVKGILIEELQNAVTGMPIGAGVYCNSSGVYIDMTVKNIWLE